MKIADKSRLFRSKKGSYSEYQKWEVQGVQLWDKNAQLPPSNRKVLTFEEQNHRKKDAF